MVSCVRNFVVLGTGTGIAITGTGYAAGGNYDYVMIPSGICQPPATAVADMNPVDRLVVFTLTVVFTRHCRLNMMLPTVLLSLHCIVAFTLYCHLHTVLLS